MAENPLEPRTAFVAELRLRLPALSRALLRVEDGRLDPGLLDALAADARAISEAATTANLPLACRLAQSCVNTTAALQNENRRFTPPVLELLLQGCEQLGSILEVVEANGEPAESSAAADQLLEQLATALQEALAAPLGEAVPALKTECADHLSESEAALPPISPQAREEVFRGRAEEQLGRIATGCRAVADGNTSEPVLASLGEALETLRAAAEYMGCDDLVEPATGLLALVESLRNNQCHLREKLTALLGDMAPPTSQPVAVTPPAASVVAVATAPPVEAPALKPNVIREPTTPRGSSAAPTMRIDQHKLDDYVNLAGELVIARNALAHVFRQFTGGDTNTKPMKDCVEKLHRIVAEIQNNAMSMRMVPVNSLFQRFPRLVRDLAKTLGKQIDLRLFGEETELDKQVAEALGDPLLHLVRNSADHGVEGPEARQAAGKSLTGSITLKAGREGNTILIDIIDDGAGIDVERLKAKAVQNGLLTAEAAAELPRESALELIFAPGLSTAKVITDVSGRGVGMDVVRSNIVALGGSVAITSREGRGTTIRLQLPLTLAVSNVILVGVAGHTYALPLECVQETVKVVPADLKSLKDAKAISLRGEIVVLKSLRDLLGVSDSTTLAETAVRVDASGRVPVVVMNAGDGMYGIVVDELMGQQEMVIKPLPGALAHLPGIGGATITGDGSVVLILDPSTLYDVAVGTAA